VSRAFCKFERSLRTVNLKIPKIVVSLLWFCLQLPDVVTAQSACIPVAREYYVNGEYANAIEVLKKCESEETDMQQTLLLASCLFLSGDLKSAWHEVRDLPDSLHGPGLLSLKARITFARGDFDVAYHYYSELFKSDTSNTTYIRQFAVCSDKLDSTDNAISYYRKALELNPNDMVSGMRLIEKYAMIDDLTSADQLSASLLASDSTYELLRLRGDILYRLKEYNEAFTCYEPLLRKRTSNADLLKKAGVCKFSNGETDIAITMLSTSHLIRPDDEITCYYLALAYQSKPDYKSSELYFKSAIANGISQNMSNYYHRLANMYETSGNYTKALEAFQSALNYGDESHKIRHELMFEIGRVYEVYFKDYKSAIRYYDHFLKTYPDSTDNKYKGVSNRKEMLVKLVK